MPEPVTVSQEELTRAADVLRTAALLVRTVGRNFYSRRLASKNRTTLLETARHLREIAGIIEGAAVDLP